MRFQQLLQLLKKITDEVKSQAIVIHKETGEPAKDKEKVDYMTSFIAAHLKIIHDSPNQTRGTNAKERLDELYIMRDLGLVEFTEIGGGFEHFQSQGTYPPHKYKITPSGFELYQECVKEKVYSRKSLNDFVSKDPATCFHFRDITGHRVS